MKFTLKWLKRHIKLNSSYSLEEICTKLDAIGIEVESVHDQQAIYDKFVIGEILSAIKHPNADTLHVCQVKCSQDADAPVMQIVCGATNVKIGMRVVLAMVGATVPNGLFLIKKSKIRGVESEGMMCSASELNLLHDYRFTSSNNGIIELPQDAPVGKKFAVYAGLDDVIIDVALTPNLRQACACVRGIARDLASAGCGELITINALSTGEAQCPIKVNIDAKQFCSEFNIFAAYGVNIDGYLSNDIVSLLRETGKLHDHPLVNISNFIMLDLGRPNHIYDLDKISGNKITIRLSNAGEKFIALGGIEYTMPSGIIVICDDEKILCLGGLMGGESSKVDQTTKNILVEFADFNHEKVLWAGQTLNINSDSRFRFESGIDIDATTICISHTMHLLQTTYNTTFSSIETAHGTVPNYLKSISFSMQQLERYLGIRATAEEVELILDNLHFMPQRLAGNNDVGWDLTIPSWKYGDINTYQDMIEEVLRMGLMDMINSHSDNGVSSYLVDSAIADILAHDDMSIHDHRIVVQSIGSRMRDVMLSRGLDEVITWSFYSTHDESDFMIGTEHICKYHFSETTRSVDNISSSTTNDTEVIAIINPINSNFAIMRRSIVPNLVQMLHNNSKRGYTNLSIFEIGHIYCHYFHQHQATCIAGLRSGNVCNNSIHGAVRHWDFYDVRDDVMALFASIGMSGEIANYKFDRICPEYYHPNKSIRIKLGNVVVAFCGELHPSIVRIKKVDKSFVMVFEVLAYNLPSKVYGMHHKKKQFSISNYQYIERDLAFILNKYVNVADVMNTIKSLNIKYLDTVEVFDVYQGKGIENDKKSVAIKIKIQPQNMNMNDEEIKNITDKIVKVITDRYNGILRDK